MLTPIYEKNGGCNPNPPIIIGWKDSEEERRVASYIHKVASEIATSSGGFANPDAVAASIVYKLTGEKVSRKLIDDYFRSKQSVLCRVYGPSSNRNGW